MQRTAIEYLTHTWNPIVMRCSPVSDGCKNCWHLRMANRMAANPCIDKVKRAAYGGANFIKSVLDTKELQAPSRLKKPARIGVQFMGDLFHDSVHYEHIEAVFNVMLSASQHTFIMLTKRPERLEQFINDDIRLDKDLGAKPIYPIPNVILGVSVEDQKTADERIPILLQTPAAKRWVSYEPALGAVDFSEAMRGYGIRPTMPDGEPEQYQTPIVDLLVAGAETGPHKRPCNLDWMRSVRDQCKTAGVPFFYKNGFLDGVKHEEFPC